MTPEERRKFYKEQVVKSQERGFATKDEYRRFGGIFRDEAVEDITKWKCKEMDHIIKILTYIAGKGNPKVKEGNATHTLEVYTHPHIGPSDVTLICPRVTYGPKSRCAYCERGFEILKDDPDDKEAKKMTNPSRRSLFQIQCFDNEAELQKGVQLWETTHWGFTRKLDTVAEKRVPRVYYADPDSGYVIHFSKKGKGLQDTEYTITDIEKRDPCPANINIYLSDGPDLLTLEDLIYVPTYDEIYELIKEEIEEEKDVKDFDLPECPFGGTFGKDFTAEAEECVNCKFASVCSEKSMSKKVFPSAEVKTEVKEEPKKETPVQETKEEPKTEAPVGRARRLRSGS